MNNLNQVILAGLIIMMNVYVGTAVNLGVKVKLNQKKQKTGINYFDDQFSGYANLNLKVGINF